jgi:hypothetical protein
MHVDEIRAALHRLPFEPFVMRLPDGRSLAVPHPDFVAVSPRRVLVVNAEDDSVAWLEPLLIVSLEFPSPPAGPASGNGVQSNSGSPDTPDKPA